MFTTNIDSNIAPSVWSRRKNFKGVVSSFFIRKSYKNGFCWKSTSAVDLNLVEQSSLLTYHDVTT